LSAKVYQAKKRLLEEDKDLTGEFGKTDHPNSV
jgi:hypothetical protein